MAIQVTIYVVARGEHMITGLWCPNCLLPSGFELPFDRISEYGVSPRAMTLRKCDECDRPLPVEDPP